MNYPAEPRNRNDLRTIFNFLIPILVAVASFVFYSKVMNVGPDIHHDGVMLKPAIDVANGRSLFRDTFTHYGPIATYFNAFGVSIWGPKVLSIRIVTALSYSLTFGLLAAVAIRLIPFVPAMLTVAATCFVQYGYTLPWASVHANLFIVLSVLALVLYFEFKSIHWAILAGAACGAVFWCRQAVGIGSVTALGIILTLSALAYRRREITKLTLGFAIGIITVFALFLGNYYVKGSLTHMLNQTVVWPQHWEVVMRGAAARNESILAHMHSILFGKLSDFAWPALFYLALLFIFRWTASHVEHLSFKRQISLAAVMALTVFLVSRELGFFTSLLFGFAKPTLVIAILAGVAAFLRSFRKFKRDEFIALILGGFVAACWLHAYPLADGPHMSWGLGLTFLYFAYIATVVIRNKLLTHSLLLGLLASPIIHDYLNILKSRAKSSVMVAITQDPKSVFHGMVAPAIPDDPVWQAAFYVDSLVRKATTTPIVNFTDDGMFAAMAGDLSMPDPYYVWWGWLGFDKVFAFSYETRRSFINRERPIIIAHELMEELFLKKMKDEDGYLEAKKFGPYVVMVHNSLLMTLGRI